MVESLSSMAVRIPVILPKNYDQQGRPAAETRCFHDDAVYFEGITIRGH